MVQKIYIYFCFVQGGKLAVVNCTDLIKLLMTHSSMKALLAEAATAYVERETGAASGIARAVQAATAPTEGQRVLQEGFQGAILGGESREQTSTSTDAAGNVYTERLAERTATLDDGRKLHVQQSQQVVEAVPFDQSVLLDAISKSGDDVMAHSTQLNGKTMLHVDTVVWKESDERKKAIKGEGDERKKAIEGEGDERKKAIKGEGDERKKAIEGEGNERKKAIKGESKERKKAIEGMKAVLKAQNEDLHQRLELHNEDLQRRLELLEQGAASNKKPRYEAQEAPEHIMYIRWNKSNTSCGWKKTLEGVTKDSKLVFSSAEDALLDMERFYAAAVDGASRQ